MFFTVFQRCYLTNKWSSVENFSLLFWHILHNRNAVSYINLGCLLGPEIENDTKFNVSIGNNGQKIILNNIRKVKPFYVNNWTSAMHIYGSVCLKAFSDEIAPFFQYLEICF